MAADSTPEEEVRRLERHYSVNPEGLVFARLADAYRRCGRLERSLELLREGLERHPDYTTGHLIEGRTLREAGRLDEAAACFRRVLDLDAGNLVALRSLAELAAERGDMDEAHRWTHRLEQADPFSSFDPSDAADRARGEREKRDTAEDTEDDGAEAGGGGEGGDGESGAPGHGGEAGEPAVAGPEPGSSDDGTSTELPGEEGLASEIAAMADEQWWSSAEEAASAPDAPEEDAEPADESDVATETMAHLYAQQGLYGEAADVYRRLLERRPDDPELQRRLEEMARRAGGSGAEGDETAGDEEDERTARAGEPQPAREAPDSIGSERERDVTAGDHFRALLRGEARPVGSAGEAAG